jgi:hypothetical protein
MEEATSEVVEAGLDLVRGGGIVLDAPDGQAARREATAWLGSLQLAGSVEMGHAGGRLRLQLRADLAEAWVPGHDTLQLCERCGLDPQRRREDLEREIAIALLAAPVAYEFPTLAELASSVRVRRNIVEAARRTELAFDTAQAERPEGWWTYAPGCSFTVLPGKPLIEALRLATQPGVSGRLYSFSCYRATEYVILLAIAEELEAGHPQLLQQLQQRWERKAIMSGQFHDVFLREVGSLEAPLPPRFYVPGDRLWFRNPDAASSDASGYEGSWVFYLGGGLFTNFWRHNRPFTLASKCVEIYHWRHAVYTDAEGEPRIDEAVVEQHVHRSMADPVELDRILARMVRLRDPKGVYGEGGCIDASREHPRRLCPGTSDLVVPAG